MPRIFKARHVRGSVRQLTCEEADCAAMANGWATVLPLESSDLLTFYFSPGQECFETHWQRDPVFIIGRSDPGIRTLIYPDGDAFVEDSDKHLRQLKEVLNG